jgi:hypothetical protein
MFACLIALQRPTSILLTYHELCSCDVELEYKPSSLPFCRACPRLDVYAEAGQLLARFDSVFAAILSLH